MALGRVPQAAECLEVGSYTPSTSSCDGSPIVKHDSSRTSRSVSNPPPHLTAASESCSPATPIRRSNRSAWLSKVIDRSGGRGLAGDHVGRLRGVRASLGGPRPLPSVQSGFAQGALLVCGQAAWRLEIRGVPYVGAEQILVGRAGLAFSASEALVFDEDRYWLAGIVDDGGNLVASYQLLKE